MTRRTAARALCALAVALGTALGPARAAAETDDAQAARLPDADAELVSKVEQYLNAVDTVHARFRQRSSNGGTATGEVWVDRPGKVRFEYDPPHPSLIVSNGTFLVHYDRELEQTSYVPVSQTPLWFLIRERIDLSRIEDYELAGIERKADGIRMDVVQAGSAPGQPGSVRLRFMRDPLQLVGWTIVDQQGIETTVTLVEPSFGATVAARLFDFGELDLPDRRRPENRGR
jgi:outer membrane lipoprotein-sorting protein